jgi:hypothetical protein
VKTIMALTPQREREGDGISSGAAREARKNLFLVECGLEPYTLIPLRWTSFRLSESCSCKVRSK